jgi:hypothetical protein
MNKLEDLREKLINILDKGRSFAMAYHADADGMGAAAILIKYLLEKGIERNSIYLYPINTAQRELEDEQLSDILSKAPDIFLHLDLCIQTDLKQIEEINKKIKYTISIDHHYYKDEQLLKLFDLYINSIFFSELTKPQVHTASKLLNTIFYNSRNDWLEIIGLEGDVAIPSMLLTPSGEATDILNLLGLTSRDDEPYQIRSERRNTLLNCLVDSDNLPSFLQNFSTLGELNKLYRSLKSDILNNVTTIKSLEPRIKFRSNTIYTHEITTKTNYEVVGQVLKGHFPYIGYNSTYILVEPVHTKGNYLVYLYTSNSLVDCFKIASNNGGGGHTNRAGFSVFGKSIETIVDTIIDTIKEMIIKGEKEYAS